MSRTVCTSSNFLKTQVSSKTIGLRKYKCFKKSLLQEKTMPFPTPQKAATLFFFFFNKANLKMVFLKSCMVIKELFKELTQKVKINLFLQAELLGH